MRLASLNVWRSSVSIYYYVSNQKRENYKNGLKIYVYYIRGLVAPVISENCCDFQMAVWGFLKRGETDHSDCDREYEQ
jgi:hypothetical protein